MTQPIEIISRALKDIGALASGETPSPDEAQDAFDMLNDLIDQWSNEDMMVFNVTEIIFPVIPGQIQYTIGPNPSTPNFVGASFNASITGSVLTVSGITSGAVAVGQTLSGSGIIDGTKIVQTLTGAGGNVNEQGTYLLNINYNTPVADQLLTAYYQKPLGIDSAYVRINTNSNGTPIANGGLDYQIACIALDDYNKIGLKTLNGPGLKRYILILMKSLVTCSYGLIHHRVKFICSHKPFLDDTIQLTTQSSYRKAILWHYAGV